MAINGNDLVVYARRSALDQTGAKADADLIVASNDAVDMLSMSRRCPWLIRKSYLQTVSPYSTGTITLTAASAVVTLSGGVFPAWAASGRIFAGNIALDVSVRDSNTQVTLTAAWGGDTTAGLSYVLFQDTYSLPTNLYAFGRVLPGQAWGSDLIPLDIETLWSIQNGITTGQEFANYYAVHYDKVVFWPYPSANHSIAYTFWIRPTPITSTSLTLTTETVDWPDAMLGILHRAIDVQVALRFGDSIVGPYDKAMAIYTDQLGRIPGEMRSTSDMPGLFDVYMRQRLPLWKTRSAP